MSFLTQSVMAADFYLRQRITACAATHGVKDAEIWAGANIWQLVTIPEWANAYREQFTITEMLNAGAAFIPEAGANEQAITDEMITVAVAALLAPPVEETGV